jgi:hypothetical protein
MQHVYLVAWKLPSEPLNVRSDVITLPFEIGGVDDLNPVIDEVVEKHPELHKSPEIPEVLSFSYFGANG